MKVTVLAIWLFALVTMLLIFGTAFGDDVQDKLQALENAYKQEGTNVGESKLRFFNFSVLILGLPQAYPPRTQIGRKFRHPR